MEAISCPSVALCVASDADGNVITSTNPAAGASAWSVSYVDHNEKLGIHELSQAEITSVACPSVSLCVASDSVGGVLTSRSPTGGPSAWAMTRAVPSGSGGFFSVTCPSSSRCIALWNGGGWCLSFCAGVGSPDIYVSEGVVGGTAWIPHLADSSAACPRDDLTCGAYVNGISCPSDLLCVADDRGGNVIAGHAPPLTRAQVQAALRGELTPSAAASRIATLLRRRVLALSFTAPSAGSVRIRWLLSSGGRQAPTRRAARGLLLARGQGTVSAGSTATIQIGLTKAGIALLRHRDQARLIAEAVFTPPNERSIRATDAFTLRRHASRKGTA